LGLTVSLSTLNDSMYQVSAQWLVTNMKRVIFFRDTAHTTVTHYKNYNESLKYLFRITVIKQRSF